MTGNQLKITILQEAIEGRLVPQDPNDEPASVLLERIREEKRRLVAEGKLKANDIVEKPIEEQDYPYAIPESWEWVRLEDITIYISRGKSPVYSETKKYPVVAQKCNQWSGFSLEKAKFADPKTVDKYAEERLLQNGDLLWNSTGIGTLGRMAIYDSSVNEYGWAVADSHVTVIRTRTDFCFFKFLYYYFASPEVQRVIEDKSDGSTKQKELAQETVRKYEVPLPPLAEQKRIVAKIEELLPKVEAYGKAQESLDKLNEELPAKLKKSILQEAIEGRLVPQDPNDEPASVLLEKIRAEKKRLVKEKKIKKSALKEEPLSDNDKLFSIPSTWEWCKLGWIGDWGAGATPAKGSPDFYTNGTIPWLRTGELNNGVVYDSEIKVTPYALQKCSLRECKIGDVLIAMYGATIGKVAIAGIELTTNQACCACTPYQVYNKYLLYYLMASKQRFIDLGEGGAQPNISREKIISFSFPLPPLAEQKRIVEKIEQLLGEIDKLKK